jgi:glycosyltransferase involved in cell wall biosynthesis
MKVIILCSNYEPGGAQRVSFRLAAALNERGIETSCWFLHRRSSNFSKELPLILYDKKISNFKNIIQVILQLIQIIKNERPDVIISFLKYANTLGLIIAFFMGVKVRVASHRAESKLELSPIMRIIDFSCAFLGIYTSITAVSNSTKLSFSYYTNNCYNKIKVIHNGLDFSYSIHSKESCRDYFKLNKNDFIVGTVGRLVSSKNHKFLLNILPFIGNVQLVIVGEGDLKLELIDEAKKLGVLERLTIIDQVKTMDIPMFLNAIDLYVMPTLCEGLSNALLEALYAGLPILSSDIPSQREVLHRSSDGLKAGVLVDLCKSTDWINEIKRLKDDEDYRKNLQENALIRAQDFTVDRMANGYISLFDVKIKI